MAMNEEAAWMPMTHYFVHMQGPSCRLWTDDQGKLVLVVIHIRMTLYVFVSLRLYQLDGDYMMELFTMVYQPHGSNC